MKHINITNWQGNITDWTKFNYVYGGLDDTLADRVNLRIPGTNLRNYIKKSDNLINYQDINSPKFTDLGNGSFKMDWRGGVTTITLPYNSFKENTQYSFTLTSLNGAKYWAYNMRWNYSDGTSERFTNNQMLNYGTYSYTSASNKTVVSITWLINFEADFYGLMLNEGQTKSYEPYGSMVMVENVDSNLQPLDEPKVTVFNQVDLGTLNWIYTQELLFQASISDIKSVNPGVMGNISCPKYTTMVWNQLADKGIATAIGYVRIKDSLYTNTTTFKEAMNGVILIYEAKDSSSASTLSMASPMQLDKTNVEEDIEYLEDTKFNEEILSEEE